MGVETATYVSDLQSANPGAADLRSQGDDHLRLIKSVLQNTFPNASKAFYTPSYIDKVASFTVLAADQNKIFGVNTGGGTVVMTLPVLGAGDAGWSCTLIKYSGTAPVLVTPPSGLISSGGANLAAARRCINGIPITIFWQGTVFVAARALAVPVGACIEYHGSSLPAGYEWPNGQTLALVATNYPEYNGVFGSGVTLDRRGRVGVCLDNLGGAGAGRLTGGVITGTAVGNSGGADTVTLSLAQLPTGITSTNAAQAISVTSTRLLVDSTSGILLDFNPPGAAGYRTMDNTASMRTQPSSGNNAIAVTSNNTSGNAHSNLQPSIMVGYILVVE